MIDCLLLVCIHALQAREGVRRARAELEEEMRRAPCTALSPYIEASTSQVGTGV